MDIFQAVIIGIIEGITEFLPISSTGHMIVASKFLGIDQGALIKAYEVIIQFAAILAMLLIYREKVNIKQIDLWSKIIVAFLPIAIVGYIFEDKIKILFDVQTVAWMSIVGGIVFLVVEYFYKEQQHYVLEVEGTSWGQAIWIGVAQVFSLIPGTSRAGATIIGGMLAGLTRKASIEFSFLLAIPVMATVSGYDILKHYQDFADANWVAFGVGFMVAFVMAYATIKLFLGFIQKFTFMAFGLYRILFGIILLSIA